MEICDNKKRILIGIEKIGKIIVNSYGPQGRTWLLGSLNNYQINDDGYKIIKELIFDDPYENIALKLILDMVSKTEEEAHDSTTLVILLACSFVLNIFENEEEIIPSIFINQWQKVLNDILGYLDDYCCKNIDINVLQSIAKICVKEEELGNIIGETIFNIGQDGVLKIKASKNEKSYVEYQKGYILNSNEKYDSRIYKDVYLLLMNETLESLVPLLDVIKEMRTSNNALLIASYDFYDDVYANLKSLLSNGIPLIVYKLPGFKNQQEQTLNDLKNISFSKIYQKKNIGNVSLNELKKVDRIELINNKIIIYNNKINENELRLESKSQLLGNSANLYVGGTTDSMINEKISRIEDAKYSCLNTLKYGYVLGGGKTLFNISSKIKDDNLVCKIFKETLKVPFLSLLHNSGYKENIKNITLSEDEGIDLINHKIISYKEDKIFDCVYGIKRALINASGLVYTLVHLYDAKINE